MRDRWTQAVLAVDQSMVDVDAVDLDAMLDDRSCRRLISAFGIGFVLPGFEIPLERLRYGRIVVVVDDSAAGRMVGARVVSFLRRYLAPVVENGLVYEARIGSLRGMSEEEFARAVLLESRNIVQI
jgi:DNA gyrase/topoisomerase IV subunit B